MRSSHLRHTSRVSLSLYVMFSILCAVVWLLTAHTNRVNYSEYQQTAEKFCKGVEEFNETFCDSIHISYVVGIENIGFRPTDVKIDSGLNQKLSLYVGDASHSIQVKYNIENPVGDNFILQTEKLGNKIKWGLNPSALHSELTVLLYVVGYPTASDYELPTCYFQKGWGGVCVIQGNGNVDNYEDVVQFEVAQRQLKIKILETVSSSSGRRSVESKTCTTLRTLFKLLDTFDNLPVTADVSNSISAAVDNFPTNPFIALKHSMAAYTSHHLVTSSYFPPDHLFAIYLPLFFPIIATVCIGLVWEMKTSKREEKEMQEKKNK